MRIFYLLTAFCFSSFLSMAQGTSGYSGTGANINVDNYQIYWRVNPDSSKGIKGIVKIKFIVVSSYAKKLGNKLSKEFIYLPHIASIHFIINAPSFPLQGFGASPKK